MKTFKVVIIFFVFHLSSISFIFCQNLIINDDFNGNQLDGSLWKTQASWGPNYQSNDAQVYLPNNVEVNNGTAKLKLLYQPITNNNKYFDYTSGTLFSAQKFHYGIFEMKCKIPKDTWPAFWLYGDCCEEIDIFEFLDCDEFNPKITIHECPPDNCNSGTGSGNNLSCGKTMAELGNPVYYDFSNGFYTWKLDWRPDELFIYVNDVQVYHCKANGSGACLYHTLNTNGGSCTIGTNTLYPTGFMNLIVNLATSLGACTPPTPSVFEIEYIKVWQYTEHCNATSYNILGNPSSSNPFILVGPQTLRASDYMTTSGFMTVKNNGLQYEPDLYWSAGNYIDINSGFDMENGASFTAEIVPCSSGFTENPTDYHPATSDIELKNQSAQTLQPVLNANKSNNVFAITPNPNNGKFQVAMNKEQSSGQKEIFIYNSIGQLIVHQSANSSSSLPIDLSSQPKGIYFIKVQTPDKVYTEKVVVQ